MKLISAFKKYFALSALQKEIIKSGKRTLLMKPDELLKILRPLAAFDQDCDAARKQAGWGMLIVCGIWIGLMIIAPQETPEVAGIFTIISLAAFFLLLFTFLLLKKIDIHNNLREFVVPVLNTVSQDMNCDEKMRIKLDLRGKCLSDKVTNVTKDDPGWFSYPKVTKTFYRDGWFDASATLCDGSRLFFSVTDFICKTDAKKKNYRGKIKYKTKYKVKQKIKVGLALKNKKYSFKQNNALTGSGDRLKCKDGAKRNVVSLTRVEISSSVDAPLEPVSMLALIGKIFMATQNAGKAG